MNLINNNPYRVLGLDITATEREIAKQINTLSTYAEMGKSKALDTDMPFLNKIIRSSFEIEEAKKQIEQSESKLQYSLFWFWKKNSVDELALEVLKEGNVQKAEELWDKAIFFNQEKVYVPNAFIGNLIQFSKSWVEADDEDHMLKKNEDEFVIERKKETSYSIPTVYSGLNYEDNWIIECDLQWKSGIDNNSYGIVFGKEKGNYFTFQLAANGYYRYDKFVDWSFNELIKWKESSFINKRSSNNLRIKKNNNEYSFYINNNLVDTFQSEQFFGQFFGFKVNSNQKISFRNFRFSKLIEDNTYGGGINVTSKNYSSIKNLSILYLCLSTSGKLDLEYFKKGISLARYFFVNENFEEYSKLIAGEKYIYNTEVLHFYINDILDSLRIYIDKSDGISSNVLITCFKNFPTEAQQFLINRFVTKQIQNVDNEIEKANSERKKSESTAIEIGKKLVANTKSDILYTKDVLGEDNFQYQIIADKLSQSIVQCGIDAFNSCKNPNGDIDYPKAILSEESYLNEYEYALQLAVTERAKERAKENLDSCKSYIKSKQNYYCWFCGNGKPGDETNFEITIYKITSRDFQGVKYQYVPIEIPRCSNCKSYHKYDFHFESVSGETFGLGFLGLLIGFAVDISRFILGNAYSIIGKNILRMTDSTKLPIKDTSHSSIEKYPLIKERFKLGWKFEKPKA